MSESHNTVLDQDLEPRPEVRPEVRELARLRGIRQDRVHAALFDDVPSTQIIGRFQILGRLGRGGMGTVLEAYDETLDRKVAVKHLHEDSAGHHRQRLLREAQALARLSHPNVVQVYDAGEQDGRLFIAMELVDGATLWDWQREPHEWSECLEVYLQAGRGLAAAHAEGIVHRDFKPSNCIIAPDGSCKVLDFGLARGVDELDEPELERHMRSIDPQELGDSSSTQLSDAAISALSLQLTRTGARLGTPAYMAPEQALGQPADARSDQFSFCVSLYEALFGVRPFDGASRVAQLVAGLTPSFEPAGSHAGQPRIPMWLRAVLGRGLSIRKDERFESMEVLLREIVRRRGRRRRRVLAGTAAAAGLVAVVAGWAALRPSPCEGWRDASMPTWTADERARVEQALATGTDEDRGPSWEPTRRALDDYAERWTAARADACEAVRVEGRGTEASLDLQLSCLDRRSQRLGAVVDRLADADDLASARAAEATRALPAIEPCLDVELLRTGPRPLPESLRPHAAEIRALIDASWAADATGRDARALPLADQAVDEARALAEDAPALLAEARINRARIHRSALRLADARADLEAVVEHAEHGGDVALAAEALVELMMVVADERDLGAFEAWMVIARGKLGRLADRPRFETALHHLEGVLAHRRERYDDAARSLRAAAEGYRALGPTGTIERGRVLVQLGLSLLAREDHEGAEQAFRSALALADTEGLLAIEDLAHDALGHFHEGRGELELAEAALRRSLELTERLHGPRSPGSLPARTLLAELLERRGELDQARQQLELTRESLGAHVPALRRAEVFGQIARFEREQGDLEAALSAYDSARAAWVSMPEPDRVELAMLDVNVADCTMQRGELEAARAGYERALNVLATHTASNDGRRLYPRLGLGHVLVALDEVDAALPHLRRADALRAELPADPWLDALVGSELGMAVLRSEASTPASDAEALRAIGAAIDFYRAQQLETTELETFLDSCGPRCSSPIPATARASGTSP